MLREDLPLPVCVLRAAALERNLARFQRFSEDAGVLLCPHAKTSMSPALFGRQLAAGAWGLTFATGAQVRVAREHGVPRIFYANELVGAADIRFVCDELRRDPGFEFYCLVDSVAGVRLLAAGSRRPGRGGGSTCWSRAAFPAAGAASVTCTRRSRWPRRSARPARTWRWRASRGSRACRSTGGPATGFATSGPSSRS